MRSIAFLLICLILGLPLSARAEEAVLARIVSVDSDRKTMDVLVIQGRGAADEGAGPQDTDTKDTSGSLLTVALPRESSEKDFSPGDLVRIWGSMGDTPGVLTADSVRRLEQDGGQGDPTGVRKRLGRGWTSAPGPRGGGGHGGH